MPAALRFGAPVRYRSAQVIFAQGQPIEHVFLIDSGLVKLSHTSADGHAATVGFRTAGWPLGVTSALLRESYFSTAQAITDAVLRPIELGDFSEALRDASVTVWVARRLARESQQLSILASHLMSLDLDERLQLLLGRLAVLVGQPTSSGRTRIPHISHEDLASAIGGSRESVTRALARLERANVIVRLDGWITVPPPRARSTRKGNLDEV